MGTGYTTLDDLESRLDRAVEEGMISEQEAREEWEDAMREEQTRRYMEEYFDDNGDPYCDFLGNPW